MRETTTHSSSSKSTTSGQRGPGRPRLDERSQAVRDRLLESATALFARRGFGTVGIREIAASAGVTPGMIAYYFGGKQGLYEAMLDHVFGRLLGQLRELGAAPAHDSEPIEAFFQLYITTLAHDPWIPQLIAREVLIGDGPLRAHFLERFASQVAQIIPALLEREKAEGRLREDLDPVLTILSLVGAAVFPYLSHPLASQVLGHRLDEAFRDRLIAHASRLFLEGARPVQTRAGKTEGVGP